MRGGTAGRRRRAGRGEDGRSGRRAANRTKERFKPELTASTTFTHARLPWRGRWSRARPDSIKAHLRSLALARPPSPLVSSLLLTSWRIYDQAWRMRCASGYSEKIGLPPRLFHSFHSSTQSKLIHPGRNYSGNQGQNRVRSVK